MDGRAGVEGGGNPLPLDIPEGITPVAGSSLDEFKKLIVLLCDSSIDSRCSSVLTTSTIYIALRCTEVVKHASRVKRQNSHKLDTEQTLAHLVSNVARVSRVLHDIGDM